MTALTKKRKANGKKVLGAKIIVLDCKFASQMMVVL